MALIRAVQELITELRAIGVPVSSAQLVDAARALQVCDIGDREQVRSALALTVVSSAEQLSAFEFVFELFFARVQKAVDDSGQVTDRVENGPDEGEGADEVVTAPFAALDDDALRALVLDSLCEDVTAGFGTSVSLLQRQLAGELVIRHARIQPGRAVAGLYYLYRVERAIAADTLAGAVLVRLGVPVLTDPADPADDSVDSFSRRLLVEQVERSVGEFRAEIQAHIRQRMVADRGASAVAQTLRRPLPEDVEFLTASQEQLHDLHDTVQPLAGKLGALITQRRRSSAEGPVNLRRTLRASLSHGGVPVDLVRDPPRPVKPELIVLADISGSVSTFAAYTLSLTFALRAHFAKLRSFVFIDGLDEVSELFAEARNVAEVAAGINERGLGVWLDGRSDYGNALESFRRDFRSALHARTTLLVLGDARSNYHSPRVDALGAIADRCGQVLWLNPEPRSAWDSGDSVMGQYSVHCDQVAECRTARQLREFIQELA